MSPTWRRFSSSAPGGGRVVASSRPERVGEFHASDPFFVEGRVSPVVQGVYPSPEDGRPRITTTVPLPGSEPQFRAILAPHLNLARIDDILASQIDFLESARSYLVTETNDLLSSARFGHPEFRRGVHSQGIDAAVGEATGSDVYVDFNGTPVVGAYRWIPSLRVALLVEVSQAEAFRPAQALLIRILLVGLGAVLILLAGVRWIARRLARPVVEVGQAAAQVAEGEFSVLATERGEEEVGQLPLSFNAMTRRLNTLYGRLQEQVEVTTRAVAALVDS